MLTNRKFLATSQGVDADPYWDNTVLLVHADGTNGSTTVTDSTGKNTLTCQGNAALSTAQQKFGGSSLYLDGTGDYVSVPHSSDFVFGIGDWTIECWVRRNAATTGYVWCKGVTSTMLGLYQNASNLQFIQGNGTSVIPNGISLTVDQWTHIAVVCSGRVISIYKDGVVTGTPYTTAVDYTTYIGNIFIGSYGDGAQNLNCYIDDFRITKGVARYTKNFVPPNQAFYNR